MDNIGCKKHNLYNFKTADELPQANEQLSVLIGMDGTEIKTVADWSANREYVKAMLKHYMYGDITEGDFTVAGEVISCEKIMELSVYEL